MYEQADGGSEASPGEERWRRDRRARPRPELVQEMLGHSPSGRSRTLGAQCEMTLTVTERCIAYIRHIVRARLQHWGREEAGAVTLLGVSELLTNVLRHAGMPEARIVVWVETDDVYVVVSDLDLDRGSRSSGPPTPSARTDSGSGCSTLWSLPPAMPARRWSATWMRCSSRMDAGRLSSTRPGRICCSAWSRPVPGWEPGKSARMRRRYQHLTGPVLQQTAAKVGGLLWGDPTNTSA